MKGGSVPNGKGRGKELKGQKGLDRPEMWDAVARLMLQSTIQHRCREAALLQTLPIPSEGPVVKVAREAGQQYHREVQAADAQRKKGSGTAAHPRIRGSSGGGKRLSVSSDAASRHSTGLDGLQDEIGTSPERSGGKTGFGREAVENETTISDKDTTEDHGRGNADGGLPVLHSVGSKAPHGSSTSPVTSRG